MAAVDTMDVHETQKIRAQKKRKTKEKWARIWFSKRCQFRQLSQNNSRNFSAEQVIAFLKSRVKMGGPAWKRLKIVEALILFRKLEPVENPATSFSWCGKSLTQRRQDAKVLPGPPQPAEVFGSLLFRRGGILPPGVRVTLDCRQR